MNTIKNGNNFCLVGGKKTYFVFGSLGDKTEILCISTIIIDKVQGETPKIPVITFESFKIAW